MRNISEKLFNILTSGSGDITYQQLWHPLFAWQSGTICAFLIEGIMRNLSVNYFKFGPVV